MGTTARVATEKINRKFQWKIMLQIKASKPIFMKAPVGIYSMRFVSTDATTVSSSGPFTVPVNLTVQSLFWSSDTTYPIIKALLNLKVKINRYFGKSDNLTDTHNFERCNSCIASWFLFGSHTSCTFETVTLSLSLNFVLFVKSPPILP